MTKKPVFDQIDATKETTYLTAEQVAELKQVSLSTVKRATTSGILKNHRVKTKKNQKRFTRRYLLADVERWRSSNFFLSNVTELANPTNSSEPKPKTQQVDYDPTVADWINEPKKS